jgi:hypothetical protein
MVVNGNTGTREPAPGHLEACGKEWQWKQMTEAVTRVMWPAAEES